MGYMETEMELDDLIEVGVVFGRGTVWPQWLVWGRRRIKVIRVVLTYEGRAGDAPLLFFNLQGETASYQVAWNRKTNIWRLKGVAS